MNGLEKCSFEMQMLYTSVESIQSRRQRGKDISGSLEDLQRLQLEAAQFKGNYDDILILEETINTIANLILICNAAKITFLSISGVMMPKDLFHRCLLMPSSTSQLGKLARVCKTWKTLLASHDELWKPLCVDCPAELKKPNKTWKEFAKEIMPFGIQFVSIKTGPERSYFVEYREHRDMKVKHLKTILNEKFKVSIENKFIILCGKDIDENPISCIKFAEVVYLVEL